MSEDDHVKLEVPICENLPQIFEKFHDLIGHPGINSTNSTAVLCMNSTLKKSHGNTPFRVMWGRDSRHADLVPVVNSVTVSSQDDIDAEEAILSHYDPLLDEFHSDDTFPLPDQPGEDIATLDEYRETTYKLAAESICTEQLKQKRQYDKKVSLNR